MSVFNEFEGRADEAESTRTLVVSKSRIDITRQLENEDPGKCFQKVLFLRFHLHQGERTLQDSEILEYMCIKASILCREDYVFFICVIVQKMLSLLSSGLQSNGSHAHTM